MNLGHVTLLTSLGLASQLLTAVVPASAAVAPSLGTAQTFAVLGGSAVTNTGATVLTGDLGVWPSLSITGFPPGVVLGMTYAGGPVALQAQSDVTIAYNALAGQACDTDLTGQDLGGLTLNAGVYCFTSAAALNGTLTLDAQGDPAAVFVFQIASTLITGSNAIVDVIGGGSDCNVFWQVGTSATIGTGTQMAGNILALTSITVTTGADVSGRLLARNGAVTLDGNNAAICVLGCTPITLDPLTLPTGEVGVAYSQTITATGGTAPYTFAVSSGTLPPGAPPFVLDPLTGQLTGTPTVPGTYVFTVTATDAQGCTGFRVYTITINQVGCPSLTLLPLTLPNPTTGSSYSVQLDADGSIPEIYTYAVTSGALPPGLTLTPVTPPATATVNLAGVATTVGIYTFTITATDGAGCSVSHTYTVGVLEALLIPTLSEWGLIAMAGMLAAAAFFALRRPKLSATVSTPSRRR